MYTVYHTPYSLHFGEHLSSQLVCWLQAVRRSKMIWWCDFIQMPISGYTLHNRWQTDTASLIGNILQWFSFNTFSTTDSDFGVTKERPGHPTASRCQTYRHCRDYAKIQWFKTIRRACSFRAPISRVLDCSLKKRKFKWPRWANSMRW